MNNQNAMQIAKMHNASQEARERAFKMEAVKNNLHPAPDKAKKLRESCEGFESIFIQKIWEQMRATIPESTLLKGREEKFWQGMYDQELAKSMASAGGIGLADMMYEQLSRGLSDASKSAAKLQAGQASPFALEIDPAPLLGTASAGSSNEKSGHTRQAGQPGAQGAAAAPQQARLAGLYSEAPPAPAPAVPEDESRAVPPARPGEATAGLVENQPDPAIEAALASLRAGTQNLQGLPAAPARPGTETGAGAGTGAGPGQHANASARGAQPPLPALNSSESEALLISPAEQAANRLAMQNARHDLNQVQGLQDNNGLVDSLKKPVRRPVSGKRTVLPRADNGPRIPAGQPVNRNMPLGRQQSREAETQALLQGTQLSATGAGPSLPGPSDTGQSSLGVEALQSFAAQQRAAQYAPGRAGS